MKNQNTKGTASSAPEQGEGQQSETLKIETSSLSNSPVGFFAGMAMQGILAKQGLHGISTEWVATQSVLLAKALIAELEKDAAEPSEEETAE